MKARVIEVRISGGSGVAVEMEQALNSFLEEHPDIEVHSSQVQVVDIGGSTQAEVLVLCTIFYS
jgi:hypothetical protein